MNFNRNAIAAGGTVLALGALGAVAVASGGSPETEKASSTQAAPPVRTVVVHRTVKVVKKRKPQKAPASSASSGAGSSGTGSGSSSSYSAPASTYQEPASYQQPSSAPKKVESGSSPSYSGGGSHESEDHGEYESHDQGGDDHENGDD